MDEGCLLIAFVLVLIFSLPTWGVGYAVGYRISNDHVNQFHLTFLNDTSTFLCNQINLSMDHYTGTIGSNDYMVYCADKKDIIYNYYFTTKQAENTNEQTN